MGKKKKGGKRKETKRKEGLSVVGPPVILVLERLKQKDCQLKANLGYTKQLCQSQGQGLGRLA